MGPREKAECADPAHFGTCNFNYKRGIVDKAVIPDRVPYQEIVRESTFVDRPDASMLRTYSSGMPTKASPRY